MKEVLPVTIVTLPSTGSCRGGSQNKGSKQKIPHEMEHIPQDKSPLKRKKITPTKPGTSDLAELLEAAVAGANREISMLFSKYTDVLRERAAGDVSQTRELEDIVMEAKNLESHLKEKKDHLRRTLALISDKLQY